MNEVSERFLPDALKMLEEISAHLRSMERRLRLMDGARVEPRHVALMKPEMATMYRIASDLYCACNGACFGIEPYEYRQRASTSSGASDGE